MNDWHEPAAIPSPARTGGPRLAGRLPSAPLAFAFLALAVLAGGWNYVAGREAQADSKRQRALLVHSDRLVSAMKDLEIGERGYVLTGQAEYLAPYEDALPQIDRELDAIARLGIRDPIGTGAALAPVRDLVSRERAFFARVVASRRDQGADVATALVATGEGRRLMGGIHDVTREAGARADAASAQIEAADGRRALALDLVSLAAAGLAVALLARQSLSRRREGQRSRERLGDVLGNAPVGLGFLDPDFGLRHMNRALSEMAERGLDAGLGAPLWAAHPALEARLRPSLEAARDRGLVSGDVEIAVPSAEAPGGTRHFRMGFYPLTRAEGAAASDGVGVAAVDTTAATLAEARAREGEAVLRAVLDTLPVGVLIAEAPSGRITGHNARAEAILGHGVMPARSGEGAARWVGFHEDGRPVTPDEWPLIRVVRDGEAFAELEVDYRCGDGRRAWIGFAGAPMRDAAGRLVGGVVVVSDIDARKRNEQALAAARDAAEGASRAKSTFLANMSHELRTPLSAIIGYSEMLQEEIADGTGGSEIGRDVGRIENNARHLLGLINDVLDLSKIESGKMEVYLETFEVEPLLRDVVAGVGGLVGQKGNRLDLRLAPGLGALRSDATKLRQILLNLVGNAAKFTENGTVTLEASRGRGGDGAERLRFAVSDTGIGMTPEQVSRLFQRFSQADASTTRRFGGTGLGLSLIKAFADMLGAEVGVESVPGRGSTFTVLIPVEAAPAAAPRPEAGAAGDAAPAEAGPRDLVLVIDDDADQRVLLERLLRREGFAVHAAADGCSGLDAARRLRPRAILLDVTMPGLDGWSVLSALKADPALAETPVVMVTSLDQRRLAASLGAADFMLKPVRRDRFSRVMDRFRTPGGGILLIEDGDAARVDIRTMLEADGWEVRDAVNGRDGFDRATERRPEVVLLDLDMPVTDGFDFLKAFRALPGCADVPVVVLSARDLSGEDPGLLEGVSQILDPGDAGLSTLVERLGRPAAGA